MDPTPFRRGRFDDLPDAPRVPHPYFAASTRRLMIAAGALGDVDTHVTIHGAGPPLLLVHGLMTSSYSWRYVLEPLGRHFTLYAPDLPGNGHTAAPAGRYHPDALVAWLAGVIDALGIRGAQTIGNSMGGYLCMRLALRDPGAMSRLINVHSPGVPEWRLEALRALTAIPGVPALIARMARRAPERWAHKNVHYWDESLKSREEAREYGAPLATPDGARAFVKHLTQTMAAGPIRAFQRELRDRQTRGLAFPIPMLLLYAERDPMVPPRFGDVMAARTGATLVRVAQASHFMHVDNPGGFVAAALPWLLAGGTDSVRPPEAAAT
jgi:pimeloyl-ACP methyl ester carboxylesterase